MKILTKPMSIWITVADNEGNVILNRTTNTNSIESSRLMTMDNVPVEFHGNICITDLNNNELTDEGIAIMKKPQHKAYNGHKNYNHWNVSLWLNNDEGLYRMTLEYISHFGSIDKAAKAMIEDIAPETPDGAPYSVTTIKAAMRGMK